MPAATTTDVTAIEPIGHAEAMTLAREAYRRLAEDFAAIPDDAWSAPTDCEGWTVRDMAGHLVGALRAAASIREQVSQQIALRRRPESMVDAMTAEQIERAAGLDVDGVIAELGRLVEPATRGRAKMPAPVRKFAKIRVQMNSLDEKWTMGYLNDIILTRDAWLHRIDLHRAVGTIPTFDAAHDGRVVADVVAEWCRRHGSPVVLTLAGPAGGVFTAGADGPAIETDVVSFARMLSGRQDPTHDLFETEVPF